MNNFKTGAKIIVVYLGFWIALFMSLGLNPVLGILIGLFVAVLITFFVLSADLIGKAVNNHFE